MLRVADNTRLFPRGKMANAARGLNDADVVSILELTVMSCFRGGLKKSAYEYAHILYRDHKDRLNPETKRTITQVLRYLHGPKRALILL